MSATLLPIDAGRRPLDDHLEPAGPEAIEAIRAAARPLAGVRVLHLTSADATGSQAPHYLRSLLPLIADAGVETRWCALAGGDHAKVGEWLSQALGGAEFAAGASEWDQWLEECAAAIEPELADSDVIVIHDAAALGCASAGGARFAWSRHEDASSADPVAAEFLPGILEAVETRDIAPAIDPLSPRNHALPRKLAGQVLRSLGLDLTRPSVCQTGAIDRWTDPHTAIDAFDLLKDALPDLQLVIAGPLPGEGGSDLRVAKEIDDYAEGRADVHVKTGYGGVGNVELNALEHVARAGLALHLRPDRSTARYETFWKGTPVVEGGDAAEVAARVEELVKDPGLAIELGRQGRERVRREHLITRAVCDELELAGSVLGTVSR